MSKDDAWLLDMLLAARQVRNFTQGVTWETFQTNDVLQNAVMHQIQIIGEAARNVSDEGRKLLPQLPWPEIVGMRHRLVHSYFQILPERVWQVVEHDLEPLIDSLARVLPPSDPGG